MPRVGGRASAQESFGQAAGVFEKYIRAAEDAQQGDDDDILKCALTDSSCPPCSHAPCVPTSLTLS